MHYTCCFDGTSTVLRADNRTVQLQDVQVGDKIASIDVRTGRMVFSDVYYVRTRMEPTRTGMKIYEVTVADESSVSGSRVLRLTWDHLVYVGSDNEGGDLRMGTYGVENDTYTACRMRDGGWAA